MGNYNCKIHHTPESTIQNFSCFLSGLLQPYKPAHLQYILNMSKVHLTLVF